MERLRAAGHRPVAVHEPGGTTLGSDVRALLVRRGGAPIHPWAEALLFSACRVQLVHEVIRPALASGGIVVADRFADSTLAYQGAGRGLSQGDLELLIRLATGGLCPELTILLDVPPRVGLARLSGRFDKGGASVDQISFLEELDLPEGWNRFEDEGPTFQERVRAAYVELAAEEPRRGVIVDATPPLEVVAQAVWEHVATRLLMGGPPSSGACTR